MPAIEQIPQLPIAKKKSWQEYLIESVMAVGGALIITVIIYAFHLYPAVPNISIVYLLLILVLASTRGRYAALLAAVATFLSFDFFLTTPLYSFTMARSEDWIELIVFLATAIITSQLTVVMRQSVEQAWLREREVRILYEAGRVINSTSSLDEQLDSIALSLVRVFSPWGVRACALLLPNDDGTLKVRADAPIRIEHFTLSPNEMEAARAVMAQGKMQEVSNTSSSEGQQALLRMIPLKSDNHILGVLCLQIEHGVAWFASQQGMQEAQEQPTDQATFFWTFLDQAILIIERAHLRAHALSNNS
jgi:two-component system sensor histidine kinase KdpD